VGPQQVLDSKDILGWDVLNWAEILPFWSEPLRTRDTRTTKVLALGEREGGLSLWLASQGFQVICSDIGGIRPVVIAQHQGFPFANRITYHDINIFNIPFDDWHFDLVICKSVIGGLKLERKNAATRTLVNQRRAVDEIHRVLKTGGLFMGAENLRGHHILRVARTWRKKGKIGWRHLTTAEILSLFGSFASVETKCFGVIPSLFRADLLNRCAHRFNRLIDPVAPDDAKYICAVIAHK
jgi:SAM-dependent methyltransferase